MEQPVGLFVNEGKETVVTLTLKAQDIEFVYDDLDTNALNFLVGDGYFCIQTGVFLEEDERLNEPSVELNEQDNSQVGGIEEVTFFRDKIAIRFSANDRFLGKHDTVEVFPPGEVTWEIVDFFNNHLFLGDRTRYANDFDPKNISPPVAKRDYL